MKNIEVIDEMSITSLFRLVYFQSTRLFSPFHYIIHHDYKFQISWIVIYDIDFDD